MTDARTEARRRIADVIAAQFRRHAKDGIKDSPEGHAAGFADAVLDLFPTVEWICDGDFYLTLQGPGEPQIPVEPVVPEEPQP